MKVKHLLESYKIEWNESSGVNHSSVTDCIKQLGLSKDEIDDANKRVRKTAEYKKIISLGLKDESSKIQSARGTILFKDEDDIEYSCYITAQARRAVKGTNIVGIGKLKTFKPTQFDDNGLMTASDVMVDNLKKAMRAVIRRIEKRTEREQKGIEKIETVADLFCLNKGSRIYDNNAKSKEILKFVDKKTQKFISNSDVLKQLAGNIGKEHLDDVKLKTDFIKQNFEIYIDTLKSGQLVFDYGKNESLTPINFAKADAGHKNFVFKGENVKDLSFLKEAEITHINVIRIECDQFNFRELAQLGIKTNLIFFNLPSFAEMPLLSILRMQKVGKMRVGIEFKVADKEKQSKFVELTNILTTALDKNLDIFEVQAEIEDLGFSKAAKL